MRDVKGDESSQEDSEALHEVAKGRILAKEADIIYIMIMRVESLFALTITVSFLFAKRKYYVAPSLFNMLKNGALLYEFYHEDSLSRASIIGTEVYVVKSFVLVIVIYYT